MTPAVFLQALDSAPEAKGGHLQALVESLRSDPAGPSDEDQSFIVDPDEFSVVPGSPFAYWVGEPIRRIFREFPPLEGNVGTVKVGLQTSDDFRFVRAWWEVDPRDIGYSPEDTKKGRGWVHFAKGGSYSPYYADVHLVVNWKSDGDELKAWAGSLYNGSHWSRIIKNVDFYFRPGLTFARRTTRFSPAALPERCIFSHAGQVVFPGENVNVPAMLGLLSSWPFYELLELHVGAVELNPQYEVGMVKITPVPEGLHSALRDLSEASLAAVTSARLQWCTRETSKAFVAPSAASVSSAEEAEERALQEEIIDDQVRALYKRAEGDIAWSPAQLRVRGARPSDDVDDRADEEAEENQPEDEESAPKASQPASLYHWALGVAFGRWDVRMALDKELIPRLQGPFDRLPRLAPAGLVGPDGLPATPDTIASETWLRARPDVLSLPEPGSVDGPSSITAADYPIDVTWNGILVDDPDHEWDIVRKVREVLEYVYGDLAQHMEEEALEGLRGDSRTPRTLRDWFRNQKATGLGKTFFDFHVQRYSKSRRKAPIYWRLCTSPGRGQSDYGVWLYYHRLTNDTLWTVLNDYVGPKREREERRVDELRQKAHRKDGAERRRLEDELEQKESMLEEIRWFEGELRKVAERGFAPNLDDGVIINMAPLHTVVPWKEPEKVWKKLEEGEYDWARLAMRYWPDRVLEKCQDDRSLALAHALETGHKL